MSARIAVEGVGLMKNIYQIRMQKACSILVKGSPEFAE